MSPNSQPACQCAAGRTHSRRLAIASVVFLSLTACQNVDDEGGPPRPWDAAAPTEYPDIRDVPPRPQLSYTVEQRRAIAEGLIADRENARYTDLAVRYRSGQSSLPPPPAPPELSAAIAAAAAALVPAPAPVLPAAAEATDDEGTKVEVNDGSFSDFLNGLARDTSPEPPATEEAPEPQTNLAPSAVLQNLAAEAEASSNEATAAAEPATPAVVPGDFKRAEILTLGRLIRLARATDTDRTTVAAPIAPVAAPVPELKPRDGRERLPWPSPRRPDQFSYARQADAALPIKSAPKGFHRDTSHLHRG